LAALTHISVPHFYELVSIVHQRLEIVAGECDFVGCVSKPFDIFLNFIDEEMVFDLGVGIVESEETLPFEMLGRLKVDSNGLQMANMKMAVGFRWEPESLFALSNALVQFVDLFGVAFKFKLSWFDILDLFPNRHLFLLALRPSTED
jgi:hypothetical protein